MAHNVGAILTCIILTGCCLPSISLAQSPSAQQTLMQYVSDLQKSPNDYALRQRIVEHAQTMQPAPAIPEQARRHYVRALTLFEDAKQPSDSAEAVEEFRQALLIAPWWGEAYMKMGLALETAQRYEEAIASLKLFMATRPHAELLRKTQDEIYKIEARRDRAARTSSPQALAAKKQNEYEDWLRKIDGRRYTNPGDEGATGVLDVRGKVLISGIIVAPQSRLAGPRGYTEHNRFEIRGRESAGPVMKVPDLPGGSLQVVYIISEDGDRITQQTRFGNGSKRERIYLWQR
jgi:tetratricopeptide (TPR) repeat protein